MRVRANMRSAARQSAAPKICGVGLVLLALNACGPLRTADFSSAGTAAYPDSVLSGEELYQNRQAALRAARWHLFRATEAQACGRFEPARQDLDQAFHLLADLEADDAVHDPPLDTLSAAVERAYFNLLPHLDHFSPDSPLVLLLEGLSEENIEELPPDAAPIVRIHRLKQQCDVPIDANAEVAASIHFFQTRGRATYATWLQRAGRYRDLILDILQQEDMPRDLFYLAMIESGFNPRAYSRARAVGLWQFMAGTGQLEGLRRTHWVDERRDPEKSTRAAARHLRGLYREFQDWRLAIAAYNAGRGRVSRAIQQAGTRDFWKLDLPRETRNYVPLFMAATIIAQTPELFGFEDVQPEAPRHAEEVEVFHPIWLKAAARCLHVSQATLRDLNPELRRDISPPQSGKAYRLRVPPGKSRTFLQCYDALPDKEKFAWHYYKVKRNENIWSIARKFGVSSRLIIEANSIKNPDRIYQGQKLYVPVGGGTPVDAAGKTYTIRPGDTLSQIAQQHQISVRDLRAWNNLAGDLIRPGDRLTLRSPRAGSRPAALLKANAGTPHTVQSGESLWEIARRFGVKVEELRTWNNLSGALIYPGQRLIVGVSPPEENNLYTVVKGDTLYSIARKFDLRAEELARQNNISLSTTLLTGMTLKIHLLNLAD